MPEINHIWDPVTDNILRETDENGDTIAVYNHEPTLYGNLISQQRNGQTSFYHFDALGSSRALTDETEGVTDTYLYDAWGVERASTGTTVNPFRWVGEKGYYTDTATGQVVVRRRMLQPTVARWTTFDPIRFFLLLPSYVYVSNSPQLEADPSGLYGCGVAMNTDRGGNGGDTCRVRHFGVIHCNCNYYHNLDDDGLQENGIYTPFSVWAEFDEPCRCCKYRQSVKRGTTHFRIARRAHGRRGTEFRSEWEEAAVPDAAFREDSPTVVMPVAGKNTTIKVRYGGRTVSHPDVEKFLSGRDRYCPTRPTGCKYLNYDTPGFISMDTFLKKYDDLYKLNFYLEFRFFTTFKFEIYDICTGNEAPVESHEFNSDCDTLKVIRRAPSPDPLQGLFLASTTCDRLQVKENGHCNSTTYK